MRHTKGGWPFLAAAAHVITRNIDIGKLSNLMAAFPITAIVGPRQAGKTTLAREFAADHYFDLENPRDAAMLAEPQLALESLSGLIVIDEVQPLAPNITTLPLAAAAAAWPYEN